MVLHAVPAELLLWRGAPKGEAERLPLCHAGANLDLGNAIVVFGWVAERAENCLGRAKNGIGLGSHIRSFRDRVLVRAGARLQPCLGSSFLPSTIQHVN
jgi:hypothetical protein